MTDYKLKVEIRTEKSSKGGSVGAKQLRKIGRVPAVVYGNNFDNVSISLEKIAFNHLFREAGTSNLIELAIADMKPFKTLVHDLQRDPLTEEIIHVDFFKVNMKEKIHAEVPLNFIGESPAVINLDGSLITPVDAIEVECLPADLPSEIEVDVSILDDFEKNIKISDLNIPEGVEVLSEPEEVVVFVAEPRSEEELAELDAVVEENVEAVEVEHTGEETPAEGEATEADTEKKSDEKSEKAE